MKRVARVLGCCGALLISSSTVLADDQCTSIREGLVDSAGTELVLGFDRWGYNYQSHLFDGSFCDAYHDADWCSAQQGVRLKMKWNDAWLSNSDCDGDGSPDRHAGSDTYIGSGAWLLTRQAGEYLGAEGELCSWSELLKIVAVPSDAFEAAGLWYSATGTEIGPQIWEHFAIIQELSSDSCTQSQGVNYLSPVGPGLGRTRPQASSVPNFDSLPAAQ